MDKRLRKKKWDVPLVDLHYPTVLLSERVVRMETTATTKGQVVIPASVRRKLGIKTGTRLTVEVDERKAQIILTPITREYITSMAGKFRELPLLKDLARERKLDKEREDRKVERLTGK